jgi:hypothetical protein
MFHSICTDSARGLSEVQRTMKPLNYIETCQIRYSGDEVRGTDIYDNEDGIKNACSGVRSKRYR